MKYFFSRLPYLKLSNIHYTATSNVNNLILKPLNMEEMIQWVCYLHLTS